MCAPPQTSVLRGHSDLHPSVPKSPPWHPSFLNLSPQHFSPSRWFHYFSFDSVAPCCLPRTWNRAWGIAVLSQCLVNEWRGPYMESACAFPQGQACRRPSSVSLLCVGLNEAWGRDAPVEAPAPLLPASPPPFTASFHLPAWPPGGRDSFPVAEKQRGWGSPF